MGRRRRLGRGGCERVCVFGCLGALDWRYMLRSIMIPLRYDLDRDHL